MKLLIVSDSVRYSTYDVYNGYLDGFTRLGIPCEPFDMPNLLDYYSAENTMALLIAKAVIKDNGFTHVLFVAGTMIPEFVLRTLHYNGLKLGFIATDDPHSSKMLLANKKYIDYYFTCEKALEDYSQQIYYVPTAAAHWHVEAKYEQDDAYKSDVCFIGSVYPNRVKPLENAIKWCVENKKKPLILGPIQGRTSYGELFVPEDSVIHTVGKHMIVENEDARKYYANANVVINMDRQTDWSPAFLNGNPHNVEVEAYSCNPRIYEVAATKSLQLYIEPRAEAQDLFGDNIYTCSTKDIGKTLDRIFKTSPLVLKQKIKKCYSIVKKYHTYFHRASSVFNHLVKR